MIFLDTNVISEALRKVPSRVVSAWLKEFDSQLALPTVAIAEISYGIHRIRPEERSRRLEEGLNIWRRRLSDRIFGFTEEAALAYGELMDEATRRGRPMSVPDGMIAAIARVQNGKLATRNGADFATTGVEIISPWDY